MSSLQQNISFHPDSIIYNQLFQIIFIWRILCPQHSTHSTKHFMKKPQSKYLVCVNDKEHSETVLRYACVRAKVTGSAVQMINVIDPVEHHTLFSVADVIQEDRKKEARKLLRDLAAKAEEWTEIKPTTTLREGGLADEIIAAIEKDSSINLLLLGVSASGAKGKLLPQLTAAIGDCYHIPLTIVPGNLTEQEIEELNKDYR